MKLNCWQYKKCGREPGGIRVADLGVCPASTATNAEGLNAGRNGGRICWALTGTLCGGAVQGTFAQKVVNCAACEFYRLVRTEEGRGFKPFHALQPLVRATEARP